MASEDLKSKEARTLELIEFLARSNDKMTKMAPVKE